MYNGRTQQRVSMGSLLGVSEIILAELFLVRRGAPMMIQSSVKN